MTKTALPAVLATALATGCIVYDDKCPNTGFDGDDGAWTDSGDAEVAQPQFWLTPAEGAPGDTLILSLQADKEVDFAAIEDLTFTGALTLCTAQAREDELLVTVYVEDGAEAGFIDLLVDAGGQDRWFVEDAFFVLGDDDGSAGGTDGSDGSGGSDGSDGSGGTDGGGGDGGSGAEGGDGAGGGLEGSGCG